MPDHLDTPAAERQEGCPTCGWDTDNPGSVMRSTGDPANPYEPILCTDSFHDRPAERQQDFSKPCSCRLEYFSDGDEEEWDRVHDPACPRHNGKRQQERVCPTCKSNNPARKYVTWGNDAETGRSWIVSVSRYHESASQTTCPNDFHSDQPVSGGEPERCGARFTHDRERYFRCSLPAGHDGKHMADDEPCETCEGTGISHRQPHGYDNPPAEFITPCPDCYATGKRPVPPEPAREEQCPDDVAIARGTLDQFIAEGHRYLLDNADPDALREMVVLAASERTRRIEAERQRDIAWATARRRFKEFESGRLIAKDNKITEAEGELERVKKLADHQAEKGGHGYHAYRIPELLGVVEAAEGEAKRLREALERARGDFNRITARLDRRRSIRRYSRDGAERIRAALSSPPTEQETQDD